MSHTLSWLTLGGCFAHFAACGCNTFDDPPNHDGAAFGRATPGSFSASSPPITLPRTAPSPIGSAPTAASVTTPNITGTQPPTAPSVGTTTGAVTEDSGTTGESDARTGQTAATTDTASAMTADPQVSATEVDAGSLSNASDTVVPTTDAGAELDTLVDATVADAGSVLTETLTDAEPVDAASAARSDAAPQGN